jgi:Zn-dependent peptidase ImmA (M78 family)/transcriptional regulator with XRE-family HTH domain
MSDLDKTIGKTVKKARERLNWTQAELAEKANFGSPQIVSLIELGERPLKASELAKLSRVLFYDFAELLEDKPLIQAAVLWRKEPPKAAEVEAQFLQDCEHYRLVEELCGTIPKNKLKELPAQLPVDLEKAQSYGEKISNALGLGKRPAEELRGILEEDFGLKLFHEPKLEGSAASAVGEFGQAVLLNSSEPPWRQNYSLAHELYHLLTWDVVPVSEVKNNIDLKNRIEKTAEAFASVLLLPAGEILSAWNSRAKENKINYADVIDLARIFGVSTSALVWRMVNLKWLKKTEAERVLKDEDFLAKDKATMAKNWKEPQPSLPSRFVYLAFRAWSEGNLSKGKLAGFLHTNLAELPGLLARYGLNEDENYEATLSVG